MGSPEFKRSWPNPIATGTLATLAFVAVGLGALVPDYVSVMGDDVGKLAALPAVIGVLYLLAWSRLHLLFIIVFVRASTETLFDLTKVSIAGFPIGIGGLLNIAALVLLAMLIFERPRLFPQTLARAWLPFLALMLIGLVITPDRAMAIRLTLQISSTAAVAFAAAYYVRSPAQLKSALTLVVWSSAIPVLFSGWQLATGSRGDFGAEGFRLQGTFAHPNPFAFYITLVISLVFTMIKGRLFTLAPWQKKALFAYLIVLIGVLLLTKTRSAWVACVAMFLAYAIVFEHRYLVYLFLAGVVALFVPGVGERLLDLTQNTSGGISSYDKLNSLAWRESLWIAALDWMTPTHYPSGYGLYSFVYYSRTFFRDADVFGAPAHNIYVQIFFELGALGIAAFAWLYGKTLVAVTGLKRLCPVTTFGIVFVIVEFLVTSASDNMLDYLSYNWYLWFVAGAGVAAARMELPAAGGVDTTVPDSSPVVYGSPTARTSPLS